MSNIIEDNKLGEVIGCSYDGETAYKEILAHNPDIELVDLLMPKLDGNILVKEIKALRPRINFIMVSQVSDYGLISESYKLGIEFFISKPLNKIEVEKVVNNVAEKIRLEDMLNSIKRMFSDSQSQEENSKDEVREIKYILSMIGMLGEKGTNDIIKICGYLINTKKSYDECTTDILCKYLSDDLKIVNQRMRRAMKKGLTNLANAGIEDYLGDDFQRYSNMLFDFDNVKAEMDFIRSKRYKGGKVNMNKFFEGLILLCDKSY